MVKGMIERISQEVYGLQGAISISEDGLMAIFQVTNLEDLEDEVRTMYEYEAGGRKALIRYLTKRINKGTDPRFIAVATIFVIEYIEYIECGE